MICNKIISLLTYTVNAKHVILSNKDVSNIKCILL